MILVLTTIMLTYQNCIENNGGVYTGMDQANTIGDETNTADPLPNDPDLPNYQNEPTNYVRYIKESNCSEDLESTLTIKDGLWIFNSGDCETPEDSIIVDERSFIKNSLSSDHIILNGAIYVANYPDTPISDTPHYQIAFCNADQDISPLDNLLYTVALESDVIQINRHSQSTDADNGFTSVSLDEVEATETNDANLRTFTSGTFNLEIDSSKGSIEEGFEARTFETDDAESEVLLKCFMQN